MAAAGWWDVTNSEPIIKPNQMKKFLLSIAVCAAAFGANAQTVYFTEDFEWLAPWAEANDAADIVGCDQASTTQPQITKALNADGVSAEQALLDRGYQFERYDVNGAGAGECIYLQANYMKFGKTGFQGSMTLPAMAELGNGVDGAVLSFDWYSQRQGSGKFDPTEIVVIVTNGDDAVQFAVPALTFENGDKAAWTRAEIALNDVTLNKDTRITIRNIDSQLKSSKALRWHIDNIKLADAAANSAADAAADLNAPKQYFNLQGVPVMNPERGIYIVRQGNNVSKLAL